ncbi:zonular occludens toxin domain-containing protein [Photobacterium sanguinicancri]|uniref:zonular occludens toxin domain-containing protein n=1 Tax=Photobacterium sanguinicancri TaxID=875932 RepID=UPI0026E3DBB2|nr:zonular occludens toxin domain-containing protein [Photobacterium sanguinicancri]MDO6499243.1 zonular occludens toxin domain-containing protein [Photobacterium sanguinicancri]MDO6499251.1 zonular occludens toxin domain-containing protein [Photobacterium sanguinicancri]
MSITLIKGRPRSGKSFESVAYHIIPALKDGRKVVTNIPLNLDHFSLVFGEHVRELVEVVPFDFDDSTPFLSDPEDYKKYKEWRNEKGQSVLFVLDECHLLFPLSGRGKSQTDLAERQIRFFSGHAHWGFDFIFLTQSDRKINRLIREDIEICIEVRKNRAVSENSYRRYVYYYGEGKKGGLIEQESREYESKYFKFYKSHTKSDGSVDEASVKDLKKWHQHWGLRIPIVLLVVGIFFAVRNMYQVFGDKPEDIAHASDVSQVERSVKPVRSPVVRPVNSNFKGLPFGEFEIFIDGYSDSSYIDKSGVYHVQKQVYFSASNQAKYELDLKLDDFYLAGYQVSVYGPCMVRLTYQDRTKLIYCREEKSVSSGVVEELSGIASL